MLKKTYYELIVSHMPYLEEILDNIDKEVKGEHKDLQGFSDCFYKAMPELHERIIKLYRKQGGEEAASTVMNGYYQNYYFKKFGKKIFRLENKISNALLVTDIKNLNAMAINFPYRSCYVCINTDLFTLQHQESGMHKAEGFFIYHSETEDSNFFRILMNAESKKEDKIDDCLFYYQFQIKKNGNIGEAIEHTGGKDVHEIYEKQRSESIWFIINTILYLSGVELPRQTKNDVPPCENKKPKKIKTWERKHGHKGQLPYYNITDPDMVDVFEGIDIDPSLTIGERMAMVRRKTAWFVTGFYNTFWVGKGRNQIKVKWIHPHWRGEDRLKAI